MAIFTAGPLAAAISGSIGGTVFSRNRGGAYMRARTIPVDPNTSFQQNSRARLATTSQDWQELTQAQRDSWLNWARQNPNTNALGAQITLSGQQAFVGLNSRLLAAAASTIDVPPIVPAPDAFTSIVQDGDLGIGDFDLTFASTLESGNQVMLFGAVLNSAGIAYVRNLFKLVSFSSVDESSPWDNESDMIARLGTLVVDQTVHIKAAQFDPATGLVSPFLTTSVVVVETS